MNNQPLVSVIMPVYNCGEFVAKAIRSIIKQTYENWELVIGNDASDDNTASVIDRFKDKRIRVEHFHENCGAVTVRNELILKSNGKYIALQDADDFSHESRLKLQVEELMNNPALGMVGCQLAYVGRRGRHLRISKKPLTYAEVLSTMYHDNAFCGATMMIERDALMNTGGGYREYFTRLAFEDYDLSLLIAQKYECHNLPHVLYFYRQHARSASKIVKIERLLARNVAVHLAKQRRDRGFDDLESGHPEEVDVFMEMLKAPFRQDESLIYRQYAAAFMYEKIYIRAILASLNAIKLSPIKMINYRTLFYCVRKTIFN